MSELSWTFRALDSEQDFDVIKAQSRWYGFGKPYEFELTMAGEEIDFSKAKEGYLEWIDANGQPLRAYGWIHQIISSAVQNTKGFYTFTLSSPLWALDQNEDTQIFLQQSPQKIVQLLIQQAPQTFWQLSQQLKNSYPAQPFLLQYQKNDFDFLNHLCARFGFWYYETLGHPSNHCILGDKLDSSAFNAKSLPWITSSGMSRGCCSVFDFQYQQNRDDSPTIVAKTDDSSLNVGQIIRLENHPIEKWNGHYRIIQMSHHFDQTAQTMRYWNHCSLLPLQTAFALPVPRKKRTLLLPAHIESPDPSTPYLDDQGRYRVKWKCDAATRPVAANSPPLARLQDYGSTRGHTPFGIHFPLRHGTEVAVSFLENDGEKPIILGAFSHILCPNTVSAANEFQYRARTYGGNEMIWDDSPTHENIHWHTMGEEQQLQLHASAQNSYIRMANHTGDLSIAAQKNLVFLIQGNVRSHVQNNYTFTVGDQAFGLVYGSQSWKAGTNIQIHSNQDLKWSVTGQHLKIQSRQATHQAKGFIQYLSQKGHLAIQAKNISGQAQTIHVFSQGKIDLGGAIQITSDGVSGSATLSAPSITCKPASGGGGGAGTVGDVLKEKEEKPVQKEAPKIFDLIALNLREDVTDACFQPPKTKSQKDPYKKDRLSSTELGYFVQQDNNAVIFIHGYNVGYGEFGMKISTPIPEFDKSIFKRTDIHRNEEGLEREFPMVAEDYFHEIHSRVADAIRSVHDEDEELLNGTGAHNWWLNMEWNLNCATQQFDQKNFEHYTRLCHISWQGDPDSTLDYMAAEEKANRVVPKVVAAIQPLINQGIKVSVVAHSLGCRVLLGVMEQLAKNGKDSQDSRNAKRSDDSKDSRGSQDSKDAKGSNGSNSSKDSKNSKKPPFEHVFLWQPAVPDDAFTNEFPNAYLVAQKITVLYSDHDNVLGPVPPYEKQHLWRKAIDPNTGFLLACVVGVIHRIDQKFKSDIESPYHFAKTMQYPMTQLWKERSTRLKFYSEWIQHHQEKASTRSDARWYSELKPQMTYMELKHPDEYRFLTILIDSIQRKDMASACRYSASWYLGEIPIELLNLWLPAGQIPVVGQSIIAWAEQASEKRAFKNADPVSKELAAIILTVLTSEATDEKGVVRPAMGYSGPPKEDPLIDELWKKGKLNLIDQKDILIEHSSMKIPNEKMKSEIYDKHICGEDGLEQFGPYVYDKKLGRYRLKKGEKK